ncbi:MAG: transposase [Pyrinomonadaceae bacterium]|nr:transposase [Pyrinomonadaceae bacterium]
MRPKATRRRFSAAEKVRILEEADACREAGEIGALLRREGIYSSLLARWRRQRAQGTLEALGAQKRGPKVQADARDVELAHLRRENERLQVRLTQAETIIDFQKKLSLLLGITGEPATEMAGQP